MAYSSHVLSLLNHKKMSFSLDTVQQNSNVKPITFCHKTFAVGNSLTVRVHIE